MESANFQFLSSHSKHLLKLASEAELLCYAVPDLSLTRLRQLLECIASSVLQPNRLLPRGENPTFIKMIQSLASSGVINREISDAFHSVSDLADVRINALHKTATNLTSLSRSLLGNAFRGELVRLDSTDEQTSELLALISEMRSRSRCQKIHEEENNSE